MVNRRNCGEAASPGQADRGFAEFNQSFSFDRRLFQADIHASIAHCEGLFSAGVLTAAEAEQIKSALNRIGEAGKTNPNYFDELPSEDVHSFVEARLVRDDWRRRPQAAHGPQPERSSCH